MAVLAFTTGLASELAFPFRGGADGFAVRHLRGADIGFNLELPQHAVHQDFQVELAHAGDHGLAGFLIGGDSEGGVFLGQGGQRFGELLHVALGLGLHSHRDHRFGDEQGLQNDAVVGIAEGVASGGVLQAENSAEVASAQLVHLFAVVSLKHHQTGDALFDVLGGVEHVAAFGQHAGIHPNEGELSVGIRHDFEGQGAEGCVVVGRTNRLAAIGQDTLNRGHVDGGGQVIDHSVENQLNTFVLKSRTAKHRNKAVLQHTVTDAFFELSFAEFAGFEKLFNQFFVVFSNTLHELCSPLRCFLGHVGRDLSFFDICAQIVLVDVGLVAH